MPATPVTYKKGKLYDLPIGDLNPDPNQPRKSMDPQALEELAASIKEHGVLQPILFRVAPATGQSSALSTESLSLPSSALSTQSSALGLSTQNLLLVVAGERRFKAAQLAGLATVPGICVEGNPSEIALVENLLRQDLTSVEEAEALQRLKDEQQYSDEQLSGVIGKARTTISDIMLINRLPVAIRDECRGDHKIGKNVLIEIARKKQERGMLTAWDTYKDKRDKAPAGRQQRDPNNQAQALDALVKTAAKISEIDNSAWTDDEKEAYRAALVNLQTAIESFLNPVSALA